MKKNSEILIFFKAMKLVMQKVSKQKIVSRYFTNIKHTQSNINDSASGILAKLIIYFPRLLAATLNLLQL